MTLCNNAELYSDGINWTIHGDTTEGALIVASEKIGFKKRELEKEYPRIWEEPFDSKTRRMITVHKKADKLLICIKGAPEEVFPLCERMMENDEIVDLDDEKKKRLNEKIKETTLQGYRSLVLAFEEIETDSSKINWNHKFTGYKDAILLGIVALYDPVRPGVWNAIDFIKKSHIRVIMITGDHPLTAKAIAKELKIWNDENNVADEFVMITGKELEKLSIDKLTEKVERISVFARTTPEYKLKIVKALQRKGHTVAMTGDGINDSPALKQADIGVAMGEKGTDVAKESAALILLDDNFNTITQAIEIGRLILFNIRKFTMYLLSCNLSEIMIMLLAIILSLPFPLLPLQLLLMNMVTDTFPALALAAERGKRDELMLRLPTKNDPVLSRKEWYSIVIQSLFMTIGTIGIFLWALNIEEKRDVAQTLVFATIGLTQIFQVLNYSSLPGKIINANNAINKYLIGAILLSLGILFIAVDVEPINDIFELQRLTFSEWIFAILVSLLTVIGTNFIIHVFNNKSVLRKVV
ncbi:MAG: cation-translocating P-type ATPase [Nitrososphaeraceae archaeon]